MKGIVIKYGILKTVAMPNSRSRHTYGLRTYFP